MNADEARFNVKVSIENYKKMTEERRCEWRFNNDKVISKAVKDAPEILAELYEKIDKLSKEGKTVFSHCIGYSDLLHGGNYLYTLVDILSVKLLESGYEITYGYVAFGLNITISW